MGIYMKIAGIKGDATAKGHVSEIVVDSVNFDASRHVALLHK